ncbi:MAG: F0F1 ATP synthase subunit epsilon [Clostridia bacterium]|nr:F0F1 ATP synthase subunit epsilon [Clostridia bacterium]
MSSMYKLEIVTPDKSFFDEDVEMTIIRTTEGDIGILKDHEPVVAPVAVGSIKIKQNGEFKLAACSGGFLTIDDERVIVITDAAEWAEEIDIQRAEESAQRAERRLNEKQGELDVLRAKISLERAMNRIRISKNI